MKSIIIKEGRRWSTTKLKTGHMARVEVKKGKPRRIALQPENSGKAVIYSLSPVVTTKKDANPAFVADTGEFKVFVNELTGVHGQFFRLEVSEKHQWKGGEAPF